MSENPHFTIEDHKAVLAAGFWYALRGQDERDRGESNTEARALSITLAQVADKIRVGIGSTAPQVADEIRPEITVTAPQVTD
jgi:hypothetical protein